MANERVVKITIVGQSDSAQKALKQTADAATQAEVKVEGFGKVFAGVGAKIASGIVAFGAFRAVTGFIGDAVSEAANGQKEFDQLGAVLKSTGGAAGVTAKQAEDLATSLQSVTTYSDQAVLGAENLLLTFTNIGKDVFPQATQTVLDMSTAMGQDLKSSALQLGKALQDPVLGITALHDVGVNFTAQQVEQVKAMVAVGDTAGAQKLILAELNKEFGGSAQAAAKGYTGQVKQLTNQYNDLKEAIGTAALPALTDFTKALSNGAKSTEFQAFIGTLTHDLQALFSGNFFDEWLVSGHKAIFLLFDAFNKGLKDLSGGRLNIDGLLGGMITVIAGEESKIKASIDQHVVAPVADGLSGKSSGSPIAPAKVEAYGAAVLASYIKGLTSAQTGDFKQFAAQFEGLFKGADGKTDANAFAGATATLAMALDELAKKGEVSNDTMLDLSSQFGLQVPEVYKLLQAYAAMAAGQNENAASSAALTEAKRVEADAIAGAADSLKPYQAAIDLATDAAKRHATAAADAIEPLQDALGAVGAAASASARSSAAAIDALQGDLERAQSAQTAASAQRQRDSAIAQSAIKGETEAYERQTDTLTEQDRALAAHYETIIGGERRAKDAADERLNGLNHAANKEDLSFLTQIKAARESGNAKEANALQHQFDARKKVRSGEMEIARAQAAVAGDEYDDKVKQIDKESKGRDELDAKNEAAAGKRVAAIQADIKGVQDAAKAEAERYAAQQRGIQAEIDRIGDAQKAQAKQDAAAITGAQDAYATKKDINAKLLYELGLHTKEVEAQATAAERTARATKETYDHTKDTVDLHNANPAAFAPVATVPPPGNYDPEFDPGKGSALPTTLPPNPPPSVGAQYPTPPSGLPQLYDGQAFPMPPEGYHAETGQDGHRWYVADGHSITEYPQGQASSKPGSSSQGNDAGSLGRSGGNALLESGGPTTAGTGGGDIHLHINAPNLTDLGNPAQQRALAATVGAASLKAWNDVRRGGPPQGVA